MHKKEFDDLTELTKNLRNKLSGNKKFILLFGYNGTGKTRLSMAFKDFSKQKMGGSSPRDTLYFNAYTEDLFYWDNDLNGDTDYKLKFNLDSRFFSGLEGFSIESRIKEFLGIFSDYTFKLDLEGGFVRFFPSEEKENASPIKISRGEETLFIWCFYLAIAKLAIDRSEGYDWVKYLYIDDPVSSLDEQHVITLGFQLASLLLESKLKAVISTHHPVFYNVLYSELRSGIHDKKQRIGYFFGKNYQAENGKNYFLEDLDDTAKFQHLSFLQELIKVRNSGHIYTYHFNMLRSVLEYTSAFFNYSRFTDCLPEMDKGNSADKKIYARAMNLFSHGKYSVFEPKIMVEDNKELFRRILDQFLERYPFPTEYIQPEVLQDLSSEVDGDE